MAFHVWLIVKLPIEEGKLLRGLLGKHYDVLPAAENKDLVLLPADNLSYAVLALHIRRDGLTIEELYDDLLYILLNINAEYYSLVISEFSASSFWNAGNIMSDKFLSFQDTKSYKSN